MKTIALSFMIAILVAGLYILQLEKYQHFSESTKTSLSDLNDKLDRKIAELSQGVNRLGEEVTHLKNQANQIAQLTTATAATPEYLNRIKEEIAVNASYQLSRLAELQLKTMHDVQNASVLLQEALDILQKGSTRKTEPLIEALNAEITKLHAIKTPNLTEIWQQLGMLETQIATLPIRGDRSTAGGSETKSNSSESNETEGDLKKGWRQALSHTWEDVKSLVKIQRHTKPLEPLFSHAEQELAYTNLRILLEQTRFAVLNRDQVVFQQSLQQAKTLLETYFSAEDSRVITFLETLASVSHIVLKPELPDLKPLLLLFQKTEGYTQSMSRSDDASAKGIDKCV